MPLRLAPTLLTLSALFLVSPTQAAPYTPTNDADVVERLPGRASDPATRRVESLRKQLAARPDDLSLRVEIAERYFDMAMAQGDPRYVGYATGALAPLQKTTPSDTAMAANYYQVRGMIEQFSHSFEPALASLAKASALNPSSAVPLLWRSAIFMVQAKYTEAAAECQKLAPLAEPLVGIGCTAYVESNRNGGLETSFTTLADAVKAHQSSAPGLLLWDDTRLAEMAWRLDRFDVAENYYESAFKLGITDQFLLGSYADFLLFEKRPAEVLTLLADWERSDILLLRLALAAKQSKDPRAADLATQMRARFREAAQRGDRLHEQEAARFELDVEDNPKKALALASANYTLQKEPRDAETLMRAALDPMNADNIKQARPALAWWHETGYEDPRISALAQQLIAQGAEK
jgi:tetratricopeptide (TPR) repeat protein